MTSPETPHVIITQQPPTVISVHRVEGPQGPQGEPGEGVPAGGTAGQVLAKVDGTDYNTEWRSFVEGMPGFIVPEGLAGDGETDDSDAIQAALDGADPGQIVWLPPGKNYAIGKSLLIPSSVQLRGGFPIGRKWYAATDDVKSSLVTLSDFDGSAAIILATPSNDITIDGITITGWHHSATNVRGIEIMPGVGNASISNVLIQGMYGEMADGVYILSDGSSNTITMNNVTVFEVDGYGFYLKEMTDCHFTNLSANFCKKDGFYIEATLNSIFANCRAEECRNGFYITGEWWQGYLAGSFVNLTTDRNDQNGILIDAGKNVEYPGYAPFMFTNLYLNRDGGNSNLGGGDLAGFQADSCTHPIIINGIVVHPGRDKEESGEFSPQHAVRLIDNVHVDIRAGWLHGYEYGLTHSGNSLLRALNIDTVTGAPAAGVRSDVLIGHDLVQRTYNFNQVYGTDDSGEPTTLTYNSTDQEHFGDTVAVRTADGQLQANTYLDEEPEAGWYDVINRAYAASQLARIDHNHDEDYAAIDHSHGPEDYVERSYDFNQVYGTDAEGEPTTLTYNSTDQEHFGDTVAVRTAEGQLRANTYLDNEPEASYYDLINRAYVATSLAPKDHDHDDAYVARDYNWSVVYGNDGAGDPTVIPYNATDQPHFEDTIAQRTAEGQLQANTYLDDESEASDYDLVNRAYAQRKPTVMVWDDDTSAYVVATGATIYIGGPTDPTSVDGDIWIEEG